MLFAMGLLRYEIITQCENAFLLIKTFVMEERGRKCIMLGIFSRSPANNIKFENLITKFAEQ